MLGIVPPGNIPVGIVWLCFDCLADKEQKCNLIQENIESEVVDSNSNTNIVDVVDMENNDSPIRRSNVNMPVNTAINPASDLNVHQSASRDNRSENTRTTVTICPKYRKGVCPHGLRGTKLIDGNKCQLKHPAPCRKYCSFGSRGDAGCKNGQTCKFFHPALCKFSLKRKLCIKDDCTFVHLKGTARKASNSTVESRTNEERAKRFNEYPKPNNKIIEDSSKSDFLVLKKMIEDLNMRFDMELGRVNQQAHLNQYSQMYAQAPIHSSCLDQQYPWYGTNPQSIQQSRFNQAPQIPDARATQNNIPLRMGNKTAQRSIPLSYY